MISQQDLTERYRRQRRTKLEIMKGEEPQTFFRWFTNQESGDELGDTIKDDIWPNPLQYFLVCCVLLQRYNGLFVNHPL